MNCFVVELPQMADGAPLFWADNKRDGVRLFLPVYIVMIALRYRWTTSVSWEKNELFPPPPHHFPPFSPHGVVCGKFCFCHTCETRESSKTCWNPLYVEYMSPEHVGTKITDSSETFSPQIHMIIESVSRRCMLMSTLIEFAVEGRQQQPQQRTPSSHHLRGAGRMEDAKISKLWAETKWYSGLLFYQVQQQQKKQPSELPDSTRYRTNQRGGRMVSAFVCALFWKFLTIKKRY